MADLKAGLTLITGGARSGKSSYAQRLAAQSGRRVVFLATAVPVDEEMTERIERHRSERPAEWRTVEEPLRLSQAIREHCQRGDCTVLDCLTTWLGNLVHQHFDTSGPAKLRSIAVQEIAGVLEVRSELALNLIVVSNEVGWGIVPADPLTRLYRDLLGELNRMAAAEADDVVLVVAGVHWTLKGDTGALSPHPA